MEHDFAQRRRVALAVAITVILVPAALLLNRGGSDADVGPMHTLVGEVQLAGQTDADGHDPSGADAPTETDAMGSTPIAYLDGTVPSRADDPLMIRIPRSQRSLPAAASFSRSITNPTACRYHDLGTIPFNTPITVTNLDNSQTVQCIAASGGTPIGVDLLLGVDAFLQIGDLTDAPLAVEITW